MLLALILVVGCLLTGAVLLFNRFAALPTPLVDNSRMLFPVLFIVLFIRSFLFEPFKIPTASMVPALEVGDFIFVSKFSYGLHLPLVHRQVLETGLPERGDIAVFRLPSDPRVNYVKRIVGLPGDRITYTDHLLMINGHEVQLDHTGEKYQGSDAQGAEIVREHFESSVHDILHQVTRHPLADQEFEVTVPAGHYFMLGDNRDDSADSRYPSVGFVPQANLVGKAVAIWLNLDNLQRVGRPIH